jgi:hypothetical protein
MVIFTDIQLGREKNKSPQKWQKINKLESIPATKDGASLQ